jgi:hypothetical protein
MSARGSSRIHFAAPSKHGAGGAVHGSDTRVLTADDLRSKGSARGSARKSARVHFGAPKRGDKAAPPAAVQPLPIETTRSSTDGGSSAMRSAASTTTEAVPIVVRTVADGPEDVQV